MTNATIKIEDTTSSQRARLAEDLSIAFTNDDVNRHAEARQKLTETYGTLMGLTPLGAVNALWDLAEKSEGGQGLMKRYLVGLLDDEAEVYRQQVGREIDIAALTEG